MEEDTIGGPGNRPRTHRRSSIISQGNEMLGLPSAALEQRSESPSMAATEIMSSIRPSSSLRRQASLDRVQRSAVQISPVPGPEAIPTIRRTSASFRHRRPSVDGFSSSMNDSSNGPKRPPTLLELSRRPSQSQLNQEEIERVVYQKAHPRRRTLDPLDNCTLYLESESSVSLRQFDGEGRLTGYVPLPSLSPPVDPTSTDLRSSRTSLSSRRSLRGVKPQDQLLEMREQMMQNGIVDPFSKPVLQPIGKTMEPEPPSEALLLTTTHRGRSAVGVFKSKSFHSGLSKPEVRGMTQDGDDNGYEDIFGKNTTTTNNNNNNNDNDNDNDDNNDNASDNDHGSHVIIRSDDV